jgi:5'(3')-deoxyribonucleotidase
VEKKLAIDLDGVLADFTIEMVRILRTELGVDLPADYQATDWMWTEADLPKNAMNKAWDIIDATPHFWEMLNPLMPNIITMAEYFNEHAGKDRDIFFITARKDGFGSSTKAQSERWLYQYLGQPKSAITVLPVKSGLDKAEVIYALQLTHSIDDHTPTICNNNSLKNGHKAYLLDQPWNQDGKSYGLKIVHSLNEFFEEVEKD